MSAVGTLVMRYSKRIKPKETRETLALLKILALGNQEVAAGRVKPAADAIARLRGSWNTA
jgi:hypothetical protein